MGLNPDSEQVESAFLPGWTWSHSRASASFEPTSKQVWPKAGKTTSESGRFSVMSSGLPVKSGVALGLG